MRLRSRLLPVQRFLPLILVLLPLVLAACNQNGNGGSGY
jgi:predicted small secreted protein